MVNFLRLYSTFNMKEAAPSTTSIPVPCSGTSRSLPPASGLVLPSRARRPARAGAGGAGFLFSVLLVLSTIAGALAYTYEASGNGFTIRDDDTACTGTTCVVRPQICNELASTVLFVSLAVDFEVLEPSKLVVGGRELEASRIESIVEQNRGEVRKGEAVVEETKERYAIEAPADFAPLECKILETIINPVFGPTLYKYSVFANGFELDPLVNATQYQIGYGTAANWTTDEDSSTTSFTEGGFVMELEVVND